MSQGPAWTGGFLVIKEIRSGLRVWRKSMPKYVITHMHSSIVFNELFQDKKPENNSHLRAHTWAITLCQEAEAERRCVTGVIHYRCYKMQRRAGQLCISQNREENRQHHQLDWTKADLDKLSIYLNQTAEQCGFFSSVAQVYYSQWLQEALCCCTDVKRQQIIIEIVKKGFYLFFKWYPNLHVTQSVCS